MNEATEAPQAAQQHPGDPGTPAGTRSQPHGTPDTPGEAHPAEATDAERWKHRALRAEGAVYHALWMRPLGPHWTGTEPETAQQMRARFHEHMERTYPDLIVRDQHRRIEVFHVADGCGCDPEAEDFEEQHSESGEDGEYLCSKKFLGYVCGSCEDEDGQGPTWKPDAVAWPCPPIVALDEPVKAVSA